MEEEPAQLNVLPSTLTREGYRPGIQLHPASKSTRTSTFQPPPGRACGAGVRGSTPHHIPSSVTEAAHSSHTDSPMKDTLQGAPRPHLSTSGPNGHLHDGITHATLLQPTRTQALACHNPRFGQAHICCAKADLSLCPAEAEGMAPSCVAAGRAGCEHPLASHHQLEMYASQETTSPEPASNQNGILKGAPAEWKDPTPRGSVVEYNALTPGRPETTCAVWKEE
ncbi:adhesion G protein-coupled receptor A3 isoform X1 [Lates japonicus]|uniref:Adhesion G protein-coupled receptor A3 isoform X1 n=1 Tax=Lates japonicus TaxID=270547 RepID=A0AAD3R4X3_LATJO|nr:adhesion G protein-coupled receptor A3 isoform X1 [Lates japonicus]